MLSKENMKKAHNRKKNSAHKHTVAPTHGHRHLCTHKHEPPVPAPT